MPYITEIEKEGDLSVALQTFSATCAANSVALGLNPANLTEISSMATSFASTVSAYSTSRVATNLAMENKVIQRKTSKSVLSKWAKTFRANPAVSDALLDQLMLPHHKTPGTKTPPTSPTDVVASADGLGLVSLKWKRNGNRSGTQYLVETQASPTGDWTIAGATTKVKFSFQSTPGVYTAFRIVASRDDLMSPASVPVVLWASGTEAQLQLAA